MADKDASDQFLYPKEPTRFEPKHLEDFLVFANRLNTSDITIQSNEAIFAEIYGRLHRLTKREMTTTEVSSILNEIYGPNATAQIMRGEDVDTHYEIRPTRNERYRHRVNGTGCYVDGHDGIQITIRTIPSTPPHLADLDLPQAIVDASAPNDGVVYITGATGSGKSTLLAAIIREIIEQEDANRKVLTYEAPIEFVFDDIKKPSSIVSQSEIPRHLPSFAAGVRNALRRVPRLILVGESRDTETISAVLEAALTGHPVYTTVHSNGVAETVRRLVGAFPADERTGRSIDIVETMRLIIWQRLAPTVDGKRVALREYLVFNEDVRDKMLEGDIDNVTSNTRRLVEEFGQPMQLDIEDKFKKGIISQRTYNILTALSRQRH
ncbi:MAG: Dot/Icm type IV secretion system ATPase DotB [Coxiellaceae bacterium]|nr:Dot/Icm type IV secretion system ATPase DotB [Coxiellaceae bacterium]